MKLESEKCPTVHEFRYRVEVPVAIVQVVILAVVADIYPGAAIRPHQLSLSHSSFNNK